MVLKILALWLDLTFKLQIDYELGTDPFLALDIDRSTHLLNYLFADRESKSSSSFVSVLILRQSSKVDEEAFDSLLRHANACVHYA
jgi:hypothetical protein